MTQMATELETDALEHLDFEPCCTLDSGNYTGDCDRPAKWVMRKSCCGSVSLGCEECKEARLMNVMAVLCMNCMAWHQNSVDAYMSIEPLRRD